VTLFNWHKLLMAGRQDLKDLGCYRTHIEPMQIISGHPGKIKIHFEAPPSAAIKKEMRSFISWFTNTASAGIDPLPALTRAGIAHLYFVSIHPFEDGNGRIARAIAEKSLSENLGSPVLIALSKVLEANKKAYYKILELNSHENEITEWLVYFAEKILEAQNYSIDMVDFLIKKTQLYDNIAGTLNIRQEKVIARMFREGLEGFKGGLSAENYISITGASRATATRDLQDLIEKKIFIKSGQLKSTRYYLNILVTIQL
jgi:Fic family protein